MKIEANDKQVQDILQIGYFKIPRFQRPYSWDHDEVSSFWNDVVKEENDSYFIGSMVVYQTKGHKLGSYFGIVDGQQRLTTMTLILAAIRNMFIYIHEDNLAKGVQRYIERPNIDNENEYILDSETSFPYLQSHIQDYEGYKIDCNVGSEERSLKEAFEFVVDSLKKVIPIQEIEESETGDYTQTNLFVNRESCKRNIVSKLKRIRDKILSLKLVFIQLDNEDDAYLIFETLNARGKDLTTSDLVKNHLLKKIKSKNRQNDSAKIQWNSILERFDNLGFQNGMDQFLYHFWLSSKSYTTEKKLFPELKNYAVNFDSAKDILKELETDSSYYLSMIRPSSGFWNRDEKKIQRSLEALQLFTVKQQSSMTLALIRAYKQKKITQKILRKILGEIEHFHFAFNAVTSRRSSGTIATNYSKFAVALTEAENHSEIQSVLKKNSVFLQRNMPSYEEFEVNFMDLKYTSRRTRNKAIIKYILSKDLDESQYALTVDYDALTIEHLLPEASIKNEEDEVVVGSIGNLILVDKQTNSEDLNNLDFQSKKKILESKSYPLDETLTSSNSWGPEQILHRTKEIANRVFHT